MPKIRPKQLWRKNEQEQIRVEEVSDQTVSGTLSNLKLGTTAVWAGSPSEFENFELIAEAPAE